MHFLHNILVKKENIPTKYIKLLIKIWILTTMDIDSLNESEKMSVQIETKLYRESTKTVKLIQNSTANRQRQWKRIDKVEMRMSKNPIKKEPSKSRAPFLRKAQA